MVPVRLLENKRLWRSAGAPATRTQMHDLFVWIVLRVVIGGRAGYVLFHNSALYLANPLDALKVWHGGMSFHGGLLGVFLALALFSWKNKLPVIPLADAIAAAAPIGLLFGRIANFINGELYGRAADVPWAFIFPHDPSQLPRHPSQLYEAALEGILLFAALRFLTHRTKALRRPGVLTGSMLVGYGMARLFVEFFREPDTRIRLTGRCRLLVLAARLFGVRRFRLSRLSARRPEVSPEMG
ncbi:prolipoprotein diacylglyceryl transferase [Palleronia sp.]|uniref:prolipoprotein diacylglyceryl transferase n=1 Tax=Palleronia sp. TaxID=1940284 RepID=UPI0035C870A1